MSNILLSRDSSIKYKIIGYFLVIVLIICAFALTAVLMSVRGKLLAMQYSKVKNVTWNLGIASVDPAAAGQWDKVGQLLREVKKGDAELQYALFIAPDGGCIASTDITLRGKNLNASDFEKNALTIKDLTFVSVPEKKNLFEAIMPVVSGKVKLGVLRLGYSNQFIVSQVAHLIFLSFFTGLAALIIGIILFSSLIQKSIIYPLSQMILLAKEVAEGDLSQQTAEIRSSGEIAALAQSLIKMQQALRDMVLKVRRTADKVANSLQEVSSTLQQMNSSTQQVSNAMVQVSKGASTQAQQAEDTFEIMEKSADSLKQVVINARSANTAVSKTTTSAETARTTANQAVERIGKLTNTVLETTTAIQSLGKMSQQIGEITETITSIADQTNLLALNAAIEAARAGEAGRGFAVVAEEVRKLAEGAAEAVRKIGGLIKSIQTGTNRAVTAIEVSSHEVQEGKIQVARIAEVLGEINKVAEEATSYVNQIAESGQKRVEEVELIVKSINEVATIAKEAASSVQEISSTTQEQTASMQQISASTQELVRLAVDLKEDVDRFKL